MPDLTLPKDAASAVDRDGWLGLMDRIGEDAGYFQTLGAHHWAFFSDQGTTLVVTFERIEDIRARAPGQMPLGFEVAQKHGWSHLCLISEGESWYRDPRVWGFFDRLVDDAFFEDFDRVVFFGAGMGAYAACAFSVAAPGATVLAIRPRATLAPEIAGWDKRNLATRKLDFTSRFGFGPDMTEGAGQVFVLVDPTEALDAAHAALYRRPWTTVLRARHAGPEPEVALGQLGLLVPLIEAAGEGRLTAGLWHRLWRARRRYGPWLRNVAARLGASERRVREAVFCRAVASKMNAPRFRRRAAELTAELAAQGVTLPQQLGVDSN